MSSGPNAGGLLGRRDPDFDPGSRQHKARRFLLRFAVGFFLLLVVILGGLAWYASTPAFENKVRGYLISTLEDATGGRVELGAFRWRLLHLEFEADNLTIHGLEAADQVPYAHVDRLRARVKIISFFRAKVGLNYLGVDKPTVHLIVYKDGSTNQPVPKKKSAPTDTQSTINSVFDLAVDRAEINDGTALVNQQALPFNLAANDLELGVNYVPARDHYTGTLSIADIVVQRGAAAKIHSKLTLQADAGRNEFNIPSLTFAAGASTLAAHAQVSNFNDPHWQIGAKGTVDLREAEALATVPGLDQGVIALDLTGKGTKALFSIDGETRLAGVNYRASGLDLRGLNAATRVHVTQDELSLNDLVAHLARGGTVDAEAHIYNWLSPSTPPVSTPATPGSKAAAIGKAAQQANQVAADNTANPAAKALPSRGVVKARLSGFTLPTILSIIAPPKFQDLGFATTASGAVEINWVGNPSDLAAEAKIALTAPPQPGHGEVPVNGAINVLYSGRENSLQVRQLDAHTPGTQIQVSGGVGLAAGRGSSLKASVTVSNLGEFNRALIALGVSSNGKKGTQAIPVQLHGQAQFLGTVTGNLAAPDVKGHLSVNNFDIALNQPNAAATAAGAQALRAAATNNGLPPVSDVTSQASCTVPPGNGAIVTCPNPSGQQVPIQVASPAPPDAATSTSAATPLAVPAAATAPPTPGTAAAAAAPQTIHFDSLSADGEYSPERIFVQSALLVRGNTRVQASGQMQAHHLSRHRLAFDNHSAITGDVAVDKAALTDLLALGGQALPVTGTLTLHSHVSGTLDNLNGGGHLNVAGGQIYGEPYRSLDADLVFAGQNIGASNLIFLEDGGKVTGEGGYNLAAKQFHFKAQGAGFDLAHFKQVKTLPLTVVGQVNFQAEGSGTATAQTIEASAHLVNLSISNPAGGPASNGAIDLNAHTQAGNLLLDVNGRLNGATVQVRGTTALSGQYQTQTRLTLANLDINPYLQLFNVQGVSGKSLISGTVALNGPLGTPKLLNGTVQLSRLQVASEGITLATDGDLQATLRNGTFTLAPLHVTGGGTDLHASGSADLFGAPRPVDVKANGALDLKIVHTLVPDATASGAVSFGVTVGGTIERPDLEGKVTFANVNLAYASLPNGLSGMNGDLVFDQGRLQVENLTATSGGGQLTFGGFVAYQQGVYADLNAAGKGVRVRYAGGISVLLDTKVRVQGTLQNLLVSGNVLLNRFSVGPNLDLSTFNSNGISPPPDPTAFGNHVRLDVRINSAPQLDINNSYAKLAGDINLNIRGTAADPSVLGHISLTEGEATFAGTHYSLQHGDIYFNNPVRIDPTIDLQATAHVEDYDVLIGLNGTPEKLSPTFRSEPPLSEQDIFQLLAVGRTAEEQQIYSNQQTQAGANTTEDALLGGALNATVSSRINKLFGGGSVKIDPNFISGTGNSTARITVQQQVGKSGTVTYATNVNSTNEQLIQGQFNLTPQISLLAVRDESGVFSVLVKLHQRYR